ncbi:Rossmann-fold NAD(P)-binding domain-containing protein [Spirosoma pollinicola]|uniref:NAD(P)-dependent oxidoreductase n=1 Tax=Spirosoma pollinicola TaxID=2057025 RepID=A0A2K8YZU6_9BACT|nr:NAD(P)-dependent oxidoreductase [Spirosoma pollinicola]AUD03094.1 NAD(P)-dependent oxidoreductase [Spirosoma pollinicola]
MSQKTISIIGCGWLGMPLAVQLLKIGYAVKGSTTSVEKLATLRQKGIDAYQLALTPEPVGDLTALLNADTALIDIPPKAGKLGDDFHPSQIDHLLEALRKSSVEHIIYVSSTSVYPELSRVVVEEDVTRLDESAAPGLVQAEQLTQQFAPDRSVTILRCGGLMGYDRIPGKYVAGRTVDSGAVPVNYLHQDDAVGILTTIISQQLTGTYNAVAPAHPTREAIYRKSCADFGYQLPTFIIPEKPVPYKSISVEKLVRASGYEFKYPDPLHFLYRL